MVYRIDFQNFMIHAVDYFSLEDLTNFQYAVISAKMNVGRRLANVVKLSHLYPDPDTVVRYSETRDKKLLEKMYLDMFHKNHETALEKIKADNIIKNMLYTGIVRPLLNHQDILMICDRAEYGNDYLDVICKILDKEFGVEVIDLNELFTKGKVGPIYIDRDDIDRRTVPVKRAAAEEEWQAISSTTEGRARLIAAMPMREKLDRLEKYGIIVSKDDKKYIDSMLLEAWNDEVENG